MTVAVVSWNTRELLRRCLESLAATAASSLASVWVVDNASADGSAEMVASEFDWVTLIASPENLGFGAAVNAVAERTESPWICAANADVALRSGALEALLAAGGDAEIAAVAPRLEHDGRVERSIHGFPTLANTALAWAGLPRRPDLTDAGDADWAHGALLLIRRTAFEQIGGFDECQWLFVEDIDLCWRLAEAGWRTRYEPAARVLHAGGAATSQAFQDRPARELVALYRWMSRRRGEFITGTFALLNLLALTARLPVFGMLALTGSERWRMKMRLARTQLRDHARAWASRADLASQS